MGDEKKTLEATPATTFFNKEDIVFLTLWGTDY